MQDIYRKTENFEVHTRTKVYRFAPSLLIDAKIFFLFAALLLETQLKLSISFQVVQRKVKVQLHFLYV